MIYIVEYTYDGQPSDKAFHFVDVENEGVAISQAKDYIEKLLYYSFEKQVDFSIEKIEVVSEKK